MFQSDLFVRLMAILEAWSKMRPGKSFFGLTLEGLMLKAKPFLDAKAEIADLDKKYAHAISKRDQAAPELMLILEGVVSAVRGDPEETQNGELYAAMGFVPKNQRASGLVRAGVAAKKPTEQGGGS